MKCYVECSNIYEIVKEVLKYLQQIHEKHI